MKLSEVRTRDPVLATAHYAASQGCEIDLEAGLITIRKGDTSVLIPLSNVLYMRPELSKKK